MVTIWLQYGHPPPHLDPALHTTTLTHCFRPPSPPNPPNPTPCLTGSCRCRFESSRGEGGGGRGGGRPQQQQCSSGNSNAGGQHLQPGVCCRVGRQELLGDHRPCRCQRSRRCVLLLERCTASTVGTARCTAVVLQVPGSPSTHPTPPPSPWTHHLYPGVMVGAVTGHGLATGIAVAPPPFLHFSTPWNTHLPQSV